MNFEGLLEMDPVVLDAVGALILYPSLAALALIDLRSFRLPDRGTMPLLAAGLLWSAWSERGWPVSACAAATCGYALFAISGAIFHRVRGREGLGLGDAKLLAAGGAWLGMIYLPWIVLISSLGALIVGLIGGRRTTPLAFGPWIAIAIGVLWYIETQ